MTDAQTFYLLLAAFYLYECLSFAPSGSQAFVGKGGRIWQWREPAFHLSGAHKDVFCAPLIPWPRLLLVFSPKQDPPSSHSPLALRHLRKRSVCLAEITTPLRRLSLLIFLHYFFVLPFLYTYHSETIFVPIAILLGELYAFIGACRFYRLHKRLFPEDKGERRLETFYNAFFPWHTMRAADLIVRKKTANWHPLLCLANDPHSTRNMRQLSRRWREATHTGDTAELTEILKQADIDPSHWNEPPALEAKQQFCPLCHTVYEAGPESCADCQNVPLQSPSSENHGSL